MKSIDFSKPVTFKIIEGMLRLGKFTQLSVSSELGVSLGQVNKVTKFLLKEKMISKENAFYSIKNAQKIIECIAQHRAMKDSLIKKTHTSLEKDSLIEFLKGKGILCLDSALEQFIPKIKTGRVCAYVGKQAEKDVLKELGKFTGNKSTLYLYKEDLPVTSIEWNGRIITEKVRTAIDLGCDNMAFAAQHLFKEVWNEKII